MAINLLPLIVLGGGAFLLTQKKKKSAKKKATGENGSGPALVPCPKVIVIDYVGIRSTNITFNTADGTSESNIPTAALDKAKEGVRDIIELTTAVLVDYIPIGCMSDRSVSVSIREEGGTDVTMPSPNIFFLIGFDIISELMEIGIYGPDDIKTAEATMVVWWNKHMPGEPLPQEPQFPEG